MQKTKEMLMVSTVGQKKATLYTLAMTLLGVTSVSSAVAQVPGVIKDSAARTASALQTASIHGFAHSDFSAKPKYSEAKLSEITRMDVIPEESLTRIIIVGTKPFTPNVQNLANPSATVITIDGRWNAGRKALTSVRRNGVNTVRGGQFSDTPQQVRIVANTEGVLPFRTQSSLDRTHWEILMDAPGAVKTVVSTPVKSDTLKPNVKLSNQVVLAETKPETSSELLPGFKPVAPQVAGIKPALIVATAAPEKQVEIKSANVAGRSTNDPPEEGRRVSLDFVAADINDVLKALSLQSGINIVTSTDVKGNVTCSMRRVSFREALDTVVNLSGYKYARVGSTYAVGTGDGVAALLRGSNLGTQITEAIPFIFSDGQSLKSAIETAFPSVKNRVSLVIVGSEGKTATSNAISSGNAPATGAPAPTPVTGPQNTPASNVATDRVIIEKVIPKGGVISVTGTQAEVSNVKEFIDSMEHALLEAPAREASAKAKENQMISARSTEVYTIRYGSLIDLIAVVNRLVPSVSVHAGPAQGFQPSTLGGSASFTTGGAAAATAAGGGTGASSSGGQAGGAGTPNPQVGTVGLNPSGRPSNTLLLTGTPEAIARAREILTQVDTKLQQISFEARVVDSNMDDLRQIGFKYELGRSVTFGEINEGAANLGANGALLNSRDANFGSIFRSPYTASASLDALETKGRIRTLARPNLSALDGQPAVVFIGDQLKYVISIQQTQQGQTIQTETATVGITLRVTGKTSPDGNITVYIHPEVSVVSRFLDLGNGISLPQIATRFVDSTVRVKDGETFALGGLIRQQDVDNIRKVPFLGDLPFFGNLLFKNRDKQRKNSEVIILLTTRILKD